MKDRASAPKELLNATIKTKEQFSGRKVMLSRILRPAWAMSSFLGFLGLGICQVETLINLKPSKPLSISVLLPSGPGLSN